MADGFLGRWSQRKQAVRAGQTLEEPGGKPAVEPPVNVPSVSMAVNHSVHADGHATQAPQPAPATLPTLDDVKALKADSSFAPFVMRDVAPEVRNAAMKKLFTDPHYNVMDGLDIYIDDYSQPSPLSTATLRQMASAKFLNLFEEDPPAADPNAVRPQPEGVDADHPPEPGVAQSAPTPDGPDTPAEFTSGPVPSTRTAPLIKDTLHDHTDLRLQPDHAAGPARLEREPE